MKPEKKKLELVDDNPIDTTIREGQIEALLARRNDRNPVDARPANCLHSMQDWYIDTESNMMYCRDCAAEARS